MKAITKLINGCLILGLSASLLIGCKKYDEGGLVSRSEKRLTDHEWKLDTYLRNGKDETSKLLISNFTETFSDGGSFTRSYTDKNGDPFSETGDWEFDDDKEQINITGVGSIELTKETSTVSTSGYIILKLQKEELWYYFKNGGDEHEFHLIPN